MITYWQCCWFWCWNPWLEVSKTVIHCRPLSFSVSLCLSTDLWGSADCWRTLSPDGRAPPLQTQSREGEEQQGLSDRSSVCQEKYPSTLGQSDSCLPSDSSYQLFLYRALIACWNRDVYGRDLGLRQLQKSQSQINKVNSTAIVGILPLQKPVIYKFSQTMN